MVDWGVPMSKVCWLLLSFTQLTLCDSAVSKGDLRTRFCLRFNNSNFCANASMQNFIILTEFNVALDFSRAPRINKVVWIAPMVGVAGGGSIFRNYKGDFMGCFSAFYNIQNALFAELHVAITTIEIAHNKGWKVIWLECDSSLVVDIFKGKCYIPWKLLNK
ncbi:hypothetical protein Lal_00004129 [Lupinus albus]|nr:hypothetical protein Lal_00004129 [Lupinus albus]